MKNILVLFTLLFAVPVFAHDEGHGPKLTDSPKQGGMISPVIDAKEIAKGEKATLVYKAELVRTADGKVRIFLYDQKLQPLNPPGFDKTAKAVLLVEKKGQISESPFPLALTGSVFEGAMPQPERKPYNIDVRFKEGARELFAAFDNLD